MNDYEAVKNQPTAAELNAELTELEGQYRYMNLGSDVAKICKIARSFQARLVVAQAQNAVLRRRLFELEADK